MDGFIKVAAAVPTVRVADCQYNTEQTQRLMVQAANLGVELICFPELGLTGYTCQDLFLQQFLLDEAETALLKLLELSRNLHITAIVGLPLAYEGRLFNCAAVLQGGKIQGLVPKTYIPAGKEQNEARWFCSGIDVPAHATLSLCGQNIPFGIDLLFNMSYCRFGIEIGHDLWAVVPPSSHLCQQGADIILCPSASNEQVGRHTYLQNLIRNQSARCHAGYLYASCGYGESTQDLVFSGHACIAENGTILAESERFLMKEQLLIHDIDIQLLENERRIHTTFHLSPYTSSPLPRRIEIDSKHNVPDPSLAPTRTVNPLPFIPADNELSTQCKEILCIQSEGLARRIEHTHAKTVVIGISGGLDSTLALLACVTAFDSIGLDRKDIIGITMPGFGTTDRTYTNAIHLMQGLGVTIREIGIKEACQVHFRDLGIDPNTHDITFENSQARERTQILMDVANQMEGIVVGTGDLSELALGWATFNGDHMSMYNVNTSIPKTLVKLLVRHFATHIITDKQIQAILLDITDTPISPELIPPTADDIITQQTETLVGPYELHDFFLFHTIRNGFRPRKVFHLAKCAFDGHDPRVTKYTQETIHKWLTIFYRRFFAHQFKRNCLPEGPRVGSCSLSPRGDWSMPSDACSAAWLRECEGLLPKETTDARLPE